MRVELPGKITDWLIALPFFHVMSTVLYLHCYGAGFGAQIGALMSINDVSRAAIWPMPAMYVFGIVIPLISYSAGYIRGKHFRENEKHPNQDRTKSFIWLVILFVGMALLFLSRDLIDAYYYWKAPSLHGSEHAVLLLVGSVGATLFIRGGLKPQILGPLLIISLFLVGACTRGLGDGYRDRYAQYETATQTRVLCKDRPVLRHVGDLLLAIERNGRKVLLENDCSVVLHVPEPAWLNQPRPISLWKRLRLWVTADS